MTGDESIVQVLNRIAESKVDLLISFIINLVSNLVLQAKNCFGFNKFMLYLFMDFQNVL